MDNSHPTLPQYDLAHKSETGRQRAEEAGVSEMLLVNSEATAESFQRTIETQKMPGTSKRHCAFGIHPHHANLYSQTLEDLLIANLKNSGAIALGEIGLDFYYDF